MEVSAIFDIGKTNKKFFLLDSDFKEVYREYTRFEEITDDDGFPCEDLDNLIDWMTKVYFKMANHPEYQIKSLNFSTYGASLVHLDAQGNRVAPFYNYLKPFPEELKERFVKDHGEKHAFELTTASPFMGMLNSGLQLYYLKYTKPELFSKIKRSVHFPQYLSALFTNEYVTDFTSLGCHTGLWDMANNKYAQWVIDEGLEDLMCPVVPSDTNFLKNGVRIGVGIHDSSSALVPYYNANHHPFTLISTGTWSICMNMYNQSVLTPEELNADCLNFLNPKGLSVKASRLFLGKHLSNTAREVSEYFGVDYQAYKSLKKSGLFVSKRMEETKLLFDHSVLKPERYGYENDPAPDFSIFDSYEDAMSQFFDEITDLQIQSLRLTLGQSEVKNIYVDGGFSSSEIFVQFLADKLPEYHVYSSSFPLGSALGAAVVVNHRNLPEGFLEKVYNVKLTEAVL
ncbi:FGGY family carbohydrate kinase [Marinoscillum sp.]|uniref:FGGY family carbohydrate kinase n=1 Tax=Marinoscillum sp. TaxID=2024838 RepID=UPI003BAC8A0E